MKLQGHQVGLQQPFFLIAGPCVIENEYIAMQSAEVLKNICEELSIQLIYKSSFDKANRSSAESYRGPGITQGLEILNRVKLQFNLSILTDVHEDTPLDEVIDVVDVLQTPAF